MSMRCVGFRRGGWFLTASLSWVVLSLCGCGGTKAPVTTTPPPPVTPPVVHGIYVGNLASSNQTQVLQFALGANGAVTPAGVLMLPDSFEISLITTDASGQLYVGGAVPSGATYQWEVLVYASGASGGDAPVRTILCGATTFQTVIGIAVDDAGQLYISTNEPTPRVVVMSATANGAAAAVRLITGAATQLGPLIYGLAVDKAGTLYVAETDGKTIQAFSSTADGNVAPVRVISGSNTGFDGLYGITVDAAGDLYVMSVFEIPGVSAATTIEEFASTADGNVAPVRTIGGDSTGLSTFVSAIRIDAAGVIYVSGDDRHGVPNQPFVETFAAGASGDVAPVTTFTSTAWTYAGYYGLGVT